MKMNVGYKSVFVFLFITFSSYLSAAYAEEFAADSADYDPSVSIFQEEGDFTGLEYTDDMFQDADVFAAMADGERANQIVVTDDYAALGGAAVYYGTEPFAGMQREELGYTHRNMPSFLSNIVIADGTLLQLFRKHASLRSGHNITLPTEFNNLVSYIFGYIKSNSFPNSERENGITHLQLARQIVRASFCFGTDPLMVASKIRRETSFTRTGVSSGEAVGFSQMTGAGIREVQHQMSGDVELSASNAKSSFQAAIRCFIGRSVYTYSTGTRVTVQTHLKNNYILDLIFGQILTKTYVSHARASGFENAADAYKRAFRMYNGDDTPVRGRCLSGQVQMMDEYACDVIAHYRQLQTGWARSVQRAVRDRPKFVKFIYYQQGSQQVLRS